MNIEFKNTVRDFDRLPHEDRDDGHLLTPRTATVLAETALSIWDTFDDYIEDGLLPLPQLGTMDVWWKSQWLWTLKYCFAWVFEELSRSREPVPNSVGQEYALYMSCVLADASEVDLQGLPVYSDDGDDEIDAYIEDLSDLLLEDQDFLWTLDPAMDGIESYAPEKLGVVNLHPDEWFKSFCSDKHGVWSE